MSFIHPSSLPVLLVIGCAVFFGSLGARIFQWLRIPQVVGYIVIGIVIGRSGLGLIDADTVTRLQPLNFFALGVIGFMIGGELHRNVFRKHGSQFLKILLSEGLSAFVAVGLLTGVLTYAFTHDLRISVSLGLLLGAIASATAPAATVDVLWEYRTRGILTTTVLAIVALDDALGLFLYSFASSIATLLLGTGGGSALASFGRAGYELGGALVLGACVGLVLNVLMRRLTGPDKALTLIVGALALLLGVAIAVDVDVILAAMVLGMTLVNLAPHRSRETFGIMEQFSPPIYALFFVFVGARLTVTGMPGWMWVLAVTYVAGRTMGKMLGANLGARWGKAPESVRKYLGLCLFSQAGVAIGLSILAGIRFSETALGDQSLGSTIVLIVTATTFLVQIIGPPAVKIAVKKGGEVGLNVREEDLIRGYTVGDLMHRDAPAFSADTTVKQILRAAADTDAMSYPVLGAGRSVVGVLTMEDLKRCLGDPQMGTWLVAADIMRPEPDELSAVDRLADGMEKIRATDLDALPVVDENRTYVGMLELRAVQRTISREVIRRRQAADPGSQPAETAV